MWRKIEGFACDYQIDIDGNAINANWKGTGKVRKLKSHDNGHGYLSYRLFDGNRSVTVYAHILVAKAFPEICGKWFEGCEVDHKDCNRKNNNAYNLRCCTSKENANNPITRKRNAEAQKIYQNRLEVKEHKREQQKIVQRRPDVVEKKRIGQNKYKERKRKAQKERWANEEWREKMIGALRNNKRSKPVVQLTMNGEFVAEFPSTREAERNGIAKSGNISACCLGKPRFSSAGGYRWMFKDDYEKMAGVA